MFHLRVRALRPPCTSEEWRKDLHRHLFLNTWSLSLSSSQWLLSPCLRALDELRDAGAYLCLSHPLSPLLPPRRSGFAMVRMPSTATIVYRLLHSCTSTIFLVLLADEIQANNT